MRRGLYYSGLLSAALFVGIPNTTLAAAAASNPQLAQNDQQSTPDDGDMPDQSMPDGQPNDPSTMDQPDDPNSYDAPDGGNPDATSPDGPNDNMDTPDGSNPDATGPDGPDGNMDAPDDSEPSMDAPDDQSDAGDPNSAIEQRADRGGMQDHGDPDFTYPI